MNPIKPTLKSEIIPCLLIITSILASFYFYSRFPARVATHWGFNGEPNGWSGSLFAAFFLPIINLAMYLLLLFVPLLDPKKDRYAEFSRAYHIFKAMIVAILTFLYFLVGFNGLGYNAPVGTITPILIGVMFIVIGNYFAKFKSNWTIGMRNMWTLSSEIVWNKTNRLAGKLFILGGLIIMLMPLWPDAWRAPLLIAIVAGLVLAPNIYSYFIYKAEKLRNVNSVK